MADLLDCICLYDRKCTRNCRRNDRPFHYPTGCTLYTFQFDFDPRADRSLQSLEHVQGFETWIQKEAQGIEAWSNGRIRIWA